MPKISVLMPVYKTPEKYLRQAIESILNQTFEDFEFLILDDCPTDTRADIVQSYTDKRIRYIKNEINMGISDTRNKLINMAEGEYLAIFDHDDISLPTRFERQVTYLDNHPEVGVVGCFAAFFQRASKIVSYPINDEEIKSGLMSACVILHPAAMIRKSVLTDNKIAYESQFSPAEDWSLWVRLVGHTQFHNIPEVLFQYRTHESNTSRVQKNKMNKSSAAVRELAQQLYPERHATALLQSTVTWKVKLFGRIPLFKIIRHKRRTTVYLFNKIKLLTWYRV